MDKQMNKKKYLEYIKIGLFYLIAGVLVLYISIAIFIPDKTVKVFGFKPYVVITNSLEPYINVNDLIIVKKPKIDDLEEEDVITFMADINYDGEKEVVTHYIYSITENNNGDTIIRTHRYFEDGVTVIPDYWVIGADDVLGQYVFKINKLGYIVQFLKSPFGIAAVVVNVGVAAGIVYLIKKGDPKVIKKEEDKEK